MIEIIFETHKDMGYKQYHPKMVFLLRIFQLDAGLVCFIIKFLHIFDGRFGASIIAVLTILTSEGSV